MKIAGSTLPEFATAVTAVVEPEDTSAVLDCAGFASVSMLWKAKFLVL